MKDLRFRIMASAGVKLPLQSNQTLQVHDMVVKNFDPCLGLLFNTAPDVADSQRGNTLNNLPHQTLNPKP